MRATAPDRFARALGDGRGPAVGPPDAPARTEAMLARVERLATTAQMCGGDIDVSWPSRAGEPARVEVSDIQSCWLIDVHPDGRCYER